jgi:hypothetical protein
VRHEVLKEAELTLEERKMDVLRQRDIKKIIKTEQKSELDRNI